MTVILAANEEEFFNIKTCTVTRMTTASHYDSDYAVNGALLLDGTAGELGFQSGTAYTELWVRFTVARNTNHAWQDWPFFELLDTTTGDVSVRLELINGAFEPWARWGSSLQKFHNTSTYAFDLDTLYTFDVHVNIHATTGFIRIYLNDSLIVSREGVDTTLATATDLDTIHFFPLTPGSSGTLAQLSVTEVLFQTTSTIGARVATISPSAAGTTSAWTGAYTDIDDLVVIGDGTNLTDNVANDVSTFTMTNLSVAAALLNPTALVEGLRGKNTAAGPQNIQHAVRSGGTDYFSASISGLGTSYANFINVREVDPATAAAWTTTNIDAVEMGAKAIT